MQRFIAAERIFFLNHRGPGVPLAGALALAAGFEERILGLTRDLLLNISANIDGMNDAAKKPDALDEARREIGSMLDIIDNAVCQNQESTQ